MTDPVGSLSGSWYPSSWDGRPTPRCIDVDLVIELGPVVATFAADSDLLLRLEALDAVVTPAGTLTNEARVPSSSESALSPAEGVVPAASFVEALSESDGGHSV